MEFNGMYDDASEMFIILNQKFLFLERNMSIKCQHMYVK